MSFLLFLFGQQDRFAGGSYKPGPTARRFQPVITSFLNSMQKFCNTGKSKVLTNGPLREAEAMRVPFL